MALPNLANETETISWLKRQDDLYENEGESEVSDADYDQVKRQAIQLYPSNKYFLGVGAPVRGDKVRLPNAMTGLTQVYEGESQEWLLKNRVTGLTTLSDKLDGTSAQILFAAEDGKLQIAYSRGDGQDAADITRHISNIPNIPKQIPAGRTVAIRAEIVIKKADFPLVQKRFLRRDGKPYRNPRNMVAGLMNSSTVDPEVYKYLNCVAYTIMGAEGSKIDQFLDLSKWGFEVAPYTVKVASEIKDPDLIALLKERKAASPYELDGLVLDINDQKLRKTVTPTTVKFKVADEGNLKTTRVVDVIYRASKDGYLKPRVQIEPVQLCGVTVTYASGFHAKYIRENRIGPGALITISRGGDVIPDIQSVLEPAKEALLPDPEEWGEWEWTKNDKGEEVDAVLSDATGRRDVRIRRFVDVFTKLKIDQLKIGSCEKLFDAGLTTIESILLASKTKLVEILGENGNKVFESMEARLNGIYWPEFVGALGFMGRGVGRKRMTALYNALEGNLEKMKDLDTICGVEGYQIKTATKVVDSLDQVLEFLAKVQARVTLKGYAAKAGPTGDRMKGQAVVFTGVRSEELEKKIQEQGGEIKSGISSSVTILVCKDPSKGSSKMEKAKALGIRILDIREMEKLLS